MNSSLCYVERDANLSEDLASAQGQALREKRQRRSLDATRKRSPLRYFLYWKLQYAMLLAEECIYRLLVYP